MLPKFALVCVLSVPLFAQGWVDRTGPNGPSPRYGHAMCYDPVHGYTLMVGGATGTVWTLNTWRWNGTSWQSLGSAPFSFSGGSSTSYLQPHCTMTFHAATGTVLLMASVDAPPYSATSWAWNGTSWTSLGDTGLSAHVFSSSVGSAYDPVRQETILFSGADLPRVAVWNGTTWTLRTALVAPYVTRDISLAWDNSVNRIVLTAIGYVSGNPIARIYEWTGLSWNLRLPATLPNRTGVSTCDSAHQRIVMFDHDWNSFPGGFQPNHTWLVQNGQFTRLSTPLEPTLREGSAMAFDSARGVCVLFGGYNTFPMGDTWEFDLGPLASFTSYGTGCVGSHGIPNIAAQGASAPRIGSTFQAVISNLPWTGPAFLVLGLSNTTYSGSPLPIDLGFLGAPTCFLRTSIDDVQGLVNVLGAASWSWTVPPVPGASFYAQVLPFDPGINPLGLTASNGGHGVIGL